MRRILAVFAITASLELFAQEGVGIGIATPDQSAILHVSSSQKGVLLPEVELYQNITTPGNGLLVFNPVSGTFFFHQEKTSSWVELAPMPSGGIIMWSGSPDDVPEGWVLCDGRQFTNHAGQTQVAPDLRGRFIVSHDDRLNAYNFIGSTGGEDTIQLSVDQLPNHTHTANLRGFEHRHRVDINATALAAGSQHKHAVVANRGRNGGSTGNMVQRTTGNDHRNETGTYYTGSSPRSQTLGADGEHTHQVQIRGRTGFPEWQGVPEVILEDVGNSEPFDNRPPYYVLAFIIKI